MNSIHALEIDERDIHIDKQSGKDFDRPQYQALKLRLRKGDTLYIHLLNRLGRNKEMILNEWKDITQNIKVHIVEMDMHCWIHGNTMTHRFFHGLIGVTGIIVGY